MKHSNIKYNFITILLHLNNYKTKTSILLNIIKINIIIHKYNNNNQNNVCQIHNKNNIQHLTFNKK
jgi:hypothetical protein